MKSIAGWSCSETPPIFEYACAEGTCTLQYQDGELWTKNPDQWGVQAMLVLAKRLEARVRDDEWETYDADGTFLHPDDVPLRTEAEAQSKALLSREFKQQRQVRNGIVGLVVALGIIAYFIGKWFENP
jgi:hypothetical protein